MSAFSFSSAGGSKRIVDIDGEMTWAGTEARVWTSDECMAQGMGDSRPILDWPVERRWS